MELPTATPFQTEPIQILPIAPSFTAASEHQPLGADTTYTIRSENYQNETQPQYQVLEKLDQSSGPSQEDITPLKESEIVKLNDWRNDCKFGDFVEGTKIMPCKVFLADKKWHPYLAPSERFDLVDFAVELAKRNEKLGVVIDLNRSFDYYNFDEIKKNCALLSEAKYMKVMLENAAVPSDESVDRVYGMLKEAHEQEKVVAIHCFNGINRTGYIVSDFLCRYFGITGKEAVLRFETARNHRIEHECMIEKLEGKYPSSRPDAMLLKGA